MRLHETCTCGSEIDIDYDDLASMRAVVDEWRTNHKCAGPQVWRRSAQSTTDSRIEFGFGYQENEVIA